MSDLISDLNQIYQTKIEIKEILGTDSDVLAYYPAYIRSMIGNSGVSYAYLNDKLSYYVETSDLESMGYITQQVLDSASYATETYVTNAITAIPSVDLSSYVTYTYLESKQYLTEIPSTYATYDAIEAMGYITQQVLDSASYATESYVSEAIAAIPGVDTSSYVTYTYLGSCGYITANDLPVVDENLIPKIGGTYTIGAESYRYKTAYISEFYGTNRIRFTSLDGISFSDLYGYPRWRIDGDGHWRPGYNNSYNIGSDSYRVSSIYAYNTYTSESTYSSKYYTAYNCDIHSNSNYNIYFDINGAEKFLMNGLQFNFLDNNNRNDSSLGTSSQPWGTTYTNNLYLNGSDINTIFPTYAYVAEHGGGGSTVIDENIVPKENNTYTLGDSTYQYAATYTDAIKFNSSVALTYVNYAQLTMKLNNTNTFMFHKDMLAPNTNNATNLGSSNLCWKNTYTYNLYLGSYNITDMINGMFSYDTTTGTLTITTL